MTDSLNHLVKHFPICRRILGDNAWERILSAFEYRDPWDFVQHINNVQDDNEVPGYLPDIALLEFNYQNLCRNPKSIPEKVEDIMVNPNLHLIPSKWCNLALLFNSQDRTIQFKPEKKDSHILVWRHPLTGKVLCREAFDNDLLALKLIVDDIDIKKAAQEENSSLGKLLAILHHAAEDGLLITPESGISRDPEYFSANTLSNSFLKTDVFTLQWHITQVCDLHCRHCYDRSDRIKLSFSDAQSVLDTFFDFIQKMNVRGHVTFTGGNPLLYPDFTKLYQTASDMGFSMAILGNPASAGILDTLVDIQPLTHFQISLEGLEDYNDYIRGPGHFKRSLSFLERLREKDIYSMVMLTLNRDNMDQVLPLADILKGKADSFTFNRLAMVGEAQALNMPDPKDFKVFLKAYVNAAKSNPVLSLKDNLINIGKAENGSELFGGCTGHGCGAAFNFVSILPDGEVHACRKFPSIIGNIKHDSLLNIYNSSMAQKYRNGSSACRGCDLFSVCRGCPAVVYGMGLDCFESRDPFCFYAKAPDKPRI
ncbi:MAG: thio(seleno)oxazole modification radical SAM maturase SbtM [Desulfobacterales bacterium]|nr:thio(seleno)oxazole modification radical SAM maturase SbtM [Desulfobacterales bacterium]